jgi:hypothetical protein
MILAIPPLVILAPAAFALGIQLASTVLSLAAVFSVVRNRLVQPGLGFLDGVLAMGPIIGMDPGRRHK